MPETGHATSAASTASWTSSSARSKSPSRRTSAATSRLASSRKTAASAAFGSVLVDDRAHLDGSLRRPGLGQLERRVQVRDVDQGEASDALFGFHEGAVGHHRLAVLEADGGRGAGRLQLLAADDPARLRVLAPPLSDPPVVLLALLLGHPLPALVRADEKQHVLHRVLLR